MTTADEATSALAPFRHRAFAILWTATVVSNIGTWLQNAAAGWLMTALDPHPLMVALVQAATALPMFLFALLGGALADIVDRRRLLLAMQTGLVVLVAALGLLVLLQLVTPAVLLAFTFAAGAGAAVIAPAWQSIVPDLVPRQDLQSAVALNGVGINISRAVGPALAGLIIVALGLAAPFWANAVATTGVVAALLWWRPDRSRAPPLPSERPLAAMRMGLRHARHNPHLRATLMRGAAFFPLASAYWALLPLVARSQIAGGPQLYGILLGAIGAGAVGGAFFLPWLKRRLGADRLSAAGSIGTALALALFGFAREPPMALAASVVAGFAWIAVLATLNVSAQVALPAWVRGRGLAVFATVLFGGLTGGSFLWGEVGALFGLPAAHFAAAALLLASLPFLGRWRLQSGAGLDLAPSMHWPAPVLAHDVESDRGPVLVTVEYRIRPEDREAFLAALLGLGGERRRDGAYDWEIFEDAALEGRYVETFRVDSWLDHLRQHQRVTNADRVVQEAVQRFHAEGAPKVTHLISARRG